MKRNKFNAQPTTITYKGKAVKCASKAEAKRFGELILLERGKKISGLEFHPKYALNAFTADPMGRFLFGIANYIGDARYVEHGKEVVEDVKGMATPVFKLKAKWFRACYPHIEFRVLKVRA